MGIEEHVAITVTADSVGLARAGFGLIAIASHNATFAGRWKLYTKTSEVLADFAATSPEYLASVAIFSQNPKVKQIIIVKMTGSVTQAYVVNVENLLNDTDYVLDVAGEGVTPEQITITSDETATNNEITAALKTALDAVIGKNYTTVDNMDSTLTATGTAAGEWFSLSTTNPARFGVRMSHAAPSDVTIAADLAAISLENDTWYWLETLYNSEGYIAAASAYIQTVKKAYVAGSCDTRDLKTSTGSQGALDVLATAGRSRTTGLYHHVPAEFADAATMGELAPREPGSWTMKFKSLEGVSASPVTATHRANLKVRFANYYYTVAGVKILAEGTTSVGTADIRGFLDNVVSLDWMEDDMAKQIFGDIKGQSKVPRTNEGMVTVENGMRATFKRAIAREIAAADPEPTVEVPDIADMNDLLPRGVRISGEFKLAGAIHTVDPVTVNVVL